MRALFANTFGGLSAQYYFRHFFFGLLISALVFYASTHGGSEVHFGSLLFIVINTFLYPYARFVYESVISFIMGENAFFVNAIFMLCTKFITMAMCWAFSIAIAPIGLAYLFYRHSKATAE